MNEIISTKYGFAPETIEKRILDQKDGPYFNELYDFVRLRKVEKKKRNWWEKNFDNLEKPIEFIRKSFCFDWKVEEKRHIK